MYKEKKIGGIYDTRILTPIKNRFGTIETSSLFYMDKQGLLPLTKKEFLSSYSNEEEKSIGTCVFPHFIGKKLIFSEIETLVVESKLPLGKRSVEGISISRLNRIVAILEKF